MGVHAHESGQAELAALPPDRTDATQTIDFNSTWQLICGSADFDVLAAIFSIY